MNELDRHKPYIRNPALFFAGVYCTDIHGQHPPDKCPASTLINPRVSLARIHVTLLPTHCSQEVYDEELERMNSAMSAENQMLLNDNRQLSALIREYEQTLENIMATFRTRAVSCTTPHELPFPLTVLASTKCSKIGRAHV